MNMCRLLLHQCNMCGIQYSCTLPNWVCPTLNNDEDGDMCELCLEKVNQEYEAWATLGLKNDIY